jgi:hypothetical protein
MKTRTTLLFILLLVLMTSLAHGLNYMYVTEQELTCFGDYIKFWHGDTCVGPVRSDSMIPIMQDPYFNDFVMTTEPRFMQGSAYNPGFGPHGQAVFNSPTLTIPTQAQWVHDRAAEMGYVLPTGDTSITRIRLADHSLRFWSWPLGTVPDTSWPTDWFLFDSTIVWVNGPLEISGTVGSTLILGAAGQVRLLDNIVYASSDTATHSLTPGHAEKFALISEGEIKVANTWANGRENSHGGGIYSSNDDSSSIVLDGFYFALGGSLTFEQQNDPDSGYICVPCGCNIHGLGGGPDDRGTIYLNGGLVQHRKGYVHRSTCSSSGYLKRYRYDNDLRFWNIPIFDLLENFVSPTALNFGNVPLGTIARDTVQVVNEYVPIKFDTVRLNTGAFAVGTVRDSFKWTQKIPVSFTATGDPASYADTLHLYNRYYNRWFHVPLAANAVTPESANDPSVLRPSSFSLSAYPNPFNARTVLKFSLAVSGRVKLLVFDLQGRQVRVVAADDFAVGDYRFSFDAGDLPSGLYFARLEAARRNATVKLLLVK